MASYTIEVDDDDRDEVPAKPWTANIMNSDGEAFTDFAGTGVTPAAAVADLFDSIGTDPSGWEA